MFQSWKVCPQITYVQILLNDSKAEWNTGNKWCQSFTSMRKNKTEKPSLRRLELLKTELAFLTCTLTSNADGRGKNELHTAFPEMTISSWQPETCKSQTRSCAQMCIVKKLPVSSFPPMRCLIMNWSVKAHIPVTFVHLDHPTQKHGNNTWYIMTLKFNAWMPNQTPKCMNNYDLIHSWKAKQNKTVRKGSIYSVTVSTDSKCMHNTHKTYPHTQDTYTHMANTRTHTLHQTSGSSYIHMIMIFFLSHLYGVGREGG